MQTTTVMLLLLFGCSGQSIYSTPSDILCEASGVCEGLLIHTEDATTTAACQDACTNFDGCIYYSHDPTADKCLMFETCPTLDENSCPQCISGSPGCEIENGESNEGTQVTKSWLKLNLHWRISHPGHGWHQCIIISWWCGGCTSRFYIKWDTTTKPTSNCTGTQCSSTWLLK